jgi:hypothetical protein
MTKPVVCERIHFHVNTRSEQRAPFIFIRELIPPTILEWLEQGNEYLDPEISDRTSNAESRFFVRCIQMLSLHCTDPMFIYFYREALNIQSSGFMLTDARPILGDIMELVIKNQLPILAPKGGEIKYTTLFHVDEKLLLV